MSAPDITEPSVAEAGATFASTLDAVVDAATRHERLLWGVVVLALVFDVLLTHVGLAAGLTEGNPAIRWAIEWGGISAHALAKGAILAIGLAIARLRPAESGVVPLGLAIPWLFAVAVNASLLY